MIIVGGISRIRWGRIQRLYEVAGQVTIPALFMVVILLIMYIYLFPVLDQPIGDFCSTGDPIICAILRFGELAIPVLILWSFWNYAMPRYEYPPIR